MPNQHFDFIVLGGGNAGLTPAHLVAEAGRRVAVIDPGPIGGLCNLGGCKPKKILVRATEILDTVRRSPNFGVEGNGNIRLNWGQVIDRKRAFSQPVTSESAASLAEAGIALLSGSPAFSSPSSLSVSDEEIEFGAALIATGSSPRRLMFPGAEHTLTTDGFMSNTAVPERMIVIGAGFSAFEFGQVAARLGAEVHLLHPGPHPLAGQDPELVRALMEFSRSLGLRVWDKATIRKIAHEGSGFIVEADTQAGMRRWAADLVLNAAGRVPNLDGLRLESANVDSNMHGVCVDPFLRSRSNRRIFAAGDAHDGYRFKLCTMACLEGRVAARNYLEGDVDPMNYMGVPQTLYTFPPLASVGLTESAAKERGHRIDVVRSELGKLEVYRIEGETVGMVKLIFDANDQRLLGAHLYGAEAGENIHIFAIAVRLGLTRSQLADLPFACPTRASGLLCMLQKYRGQGLTPH